MNIEHEYLDERAVSRLIKRALSSIRNDRHHRRNLPYIKFGRSVRYNKDDVIAFMESRKIKTEPITAGMKEGSHGTQDQT